MTSQGSFACLTTKYEQIAKLETFLFLQTLGGGGGGGGVPPPLNLLLVGMVYYYIIYKYWPVV